MPLKKRARMMEVQYPLEHAINKKVIHRVPLWALIHDGSHEGCCQTIAIKNECFQPHGQVKIVSHFI